MPDSEEIQKQLTALRLEFASSLVPRVNQITEDINLLVTQTEPVASLQEIFRQIHSLSGSAGTFGFSQLSGQLRQLELILKENINEKSLPRKHPKMTNL